ncbi:hypothetical protein GCM10011504_49530 [Siccirubricoccus deserti]|uniref:Uncharacterized protein n=1 Tax=Siccirubricoccus deserti TaxID=2013562 RepID=A0A9X0R405_9PROT|nr:hypothetical protein [Siccirubricoccus deserti]MBC4018428.1 hypothetical protein [Siccirubricoccus deserti]GGC65632.1 hypothetical protein GCM10011504_49530 [Siccirubricoccus deserti]
MKAQELEFPQKSATDLRLSITVVLFGMPRRSDLTIESIQGNMISPCVEAGLSVESVASFNLVHRVSSARSGELDVAIEAQSYIGFGADYTLIKKQDHADVVELVEISKRYRDVYKDEWVSVRNCFHQLLSLKRAWKFIEDNQIRSNFYLFLRPDLLYHDRLDVPRMVTAVGASGGVALPFWHSWNGHNDRMAFAAPPAAAAYANRVDLVPAFCAKAGFMQPEQLLKFALCEAGVRVHDIGVTASRVRANGSIKREEFTKSMHKPRSQ